MFMRQEDLLTVACWEFFSLKILSGILSVLNSVDPDQAQPFVEPDLGPNCL